MKKIFLCMLVIVFLLTSCGGEKQDVTTGTQNNMVEPSEVRETSESEGLTSEDNIDFWEQTNSKEDGKALEFITGLQIIFPKEWEDKIVIDIEPAVKNYGGGFVVSEKQNNEAIAGGMLFALKYYQYDKNSIEPNEIFGMDKVLGVYQKGEDIYALVFTRPRDMQYVEENEEMRQIYEEVSSYTDKVQVITDNMVGFTKCDLEDLDWIVLNGAEQPESVDMISYQNKNIQLEYPDVWELQEEIGEDGNVIRFYDEDGENVFWVEQGEAWRADLNIDKEDYKKQLLESFQEVEIIESSEVEVNGYDARKWTFSCTINGEKRTICRYIVVVGYTFFEFNYMVSPDTKAENKVEETVISSVKFINADFNN